MDGKQYLECDQEYCDFAVGHLPPEGQGENIAISCNYDARTFLTGEDVPPECPHKQAVYGLIIGEIRRN